MCKVLRLQKLQFNVHIKPQNGKEEMLVTLIMATEHSLEITQNSVKRHTVSLAEERGGQTGSS